MSLAPPALSRRAAREQSAFRALLEAMARPGTVGRIAPHPEGGSFAAPIAVLEALLDHEVGFALVPDHDAARETLLRYTGSRVQTPERADYLLCHGAEGIAAGLRAAMDGQLEYPDRSGTVVALVASVSGREGAGEMVRLAGPGVRTTAEVWVDGVTREHRSLFVERNRSVPNGVDLVLVASDGCLTCLPRYTRIVTGAT
jgi:alpha-D-ribose 1-methylphosphonate 5-triphosphate synthase subunit PhnH